MENQKKILENQPGPPIASTGPGPFNLLPSGEIRPQYLSHSAVEKSSKSNRVLRSENIKKIDNLSKMTRSVRSTSANARGRVHITTSNVEGKQVETSSPSSYNRPPFHISPPKSIARTVDAVKKNEMQDNHLSTMEILTKGLGRPVETGTQLTVMETPEELNRLVLARATAVAGPASFALDNTIERDSTIDEVYSFVVVDNVHFNSQLNTAAPFSNNISTSRLDPTKPAFTPLQSLQRTNELESMVHLADHDRQQKESQQSMERNDLHQRQVTRAEVPFINSKMSSLTPVHDDEFKQQIENKNNNNNKNDFIKQQIENKNNNKHDFIYNNPMMSFIDPVAQLPGYKINETQHTMNNNNNINYDNNNNNNDTYGRDFHQDEWYKERIRSPMTYKTCTINSDQDSDAEMVETTHDNDKEQIIISSQNLLLQTTIMDSIMLSRDNDPFPSNTPFVAPSPSRAAQQTSDLRIIADRRSQQWNQESPNTTNATYPTFLNVKPTRPVIVDLTDDEIKTQHHSTVLPPNNNNKLFTATGNAPHINPRPKHVTLNTVSVPQHKRSNRIRKQDSSSDDSQRKRNNGGQSTMMEKLMETIVGMGKQIQAQTTSQTEVVTAAISMAAIQQRIEIVDLISVSSEQLEQKMHTSIQESTQTLRREFNERMLQLEQCNMKTLASVKLPVAEIDDRGLYNPCHHDTWIPDSQVVGWKELYAAAWKTLNPTGATAFLPATTAATECGLHHAL